MDSASWRLMRLLVVAILAFGGIACASHKEELPPWETLTNKRAPGAGSGSTEGTYSSGTNGDPNGNGNGGGGTADDGGGAGNGNGNGGNGGNGNGGAGKGGGVDAGRSQVCMDLSTCCAHEKFCTEEVFACQGVALLGDDTVCGVVLKAYEAIGCSNKKNLGAAIIPGFPGCPVPNGGFF